MRFWRVLQASVIVFVASLVGAHADGWNAAKGKEDYIHALMPPGIQVIITELEGPVFADAQGHTLYKWPKKSLRNGDAGEIQGKPTCDDQVYRVNAGLMSPYPGGLELPEVDARPSCTKVWPPVLALQDSKPLGKWTIVDRLDGRKQWAYDNWPLYTSVLDSQPGDVLGGTELSHDPETGALRLPVGPDSNVPPQFSVKTTMGGRLVALSDGWSVYSYVRDSRNKSNCFDACLDGWLPILAGSYAHPIGEWTTFERSPGVRQWAFRGMPLYRYLSDPKVHSMDGSDIQGWHNTYTQLAPEPPKGFTMKDTMVGVVLGDERGMTIYRYRCTDDAIDQLACDYPEAPQVYRLAMCGGGEVDQCLKAFPYVPAPPGARANNHVWSTLYINPKTGKRATAAQPGALHVWAFRGRPVYTFAGDRGYGDKKPSDLLAQDWGEFNGQRNGFLAMVFRDIFSARDQ
jgi:predicted lipoprotein with Yx(FWY)xxD motif